MHACTPAATSFLWRPQWFTTVCTYRHMHIYTHNCSLQVDQVRVISREEMPLLGHLRNVCSADSKWTPCLHSRWGRTVGRRRLPAFRTLSRFPMDTTKAFATPSQIVTLMVGVSITRHCPLAPSPTATLSPQPQRVRAQLPPRPDGRVAEHRPGGSPSFARSRAGTFARPSSPGTASPARPLRAGHLLGPERPQRQPPAATRPKAH